MKKPKYTDEFKNKVIDAYYSKKTINEIINKYGVSYGSIYNWVNKRRITSKEQLNNTDLSSTVEIVQKNIIYDEYKRVVKENQALKNMLLTLLKEE